MVLNKNYKKLDLENCRAKPGLRFVNYIIDVAFFYLIIFCLGIVFKAVKPELLGGLDYGKVDQLIGLVFYGIIMSFIEGISNGKSIGKLITKTKAVNLDGSAINFANAFGRNMFRAIPFNVFSAFGTPYNPWHDRLSYTMVIEEKKASLLKRKSALFKSLKENI